MSNKQKLPCIHHYCTVNINFYYFFIIFSFSLFFSTFPKFQQFSTVSSNKLISRATISLVSSLVLRILLERICQIFFQIKKVSSPHVLIHMCVHASERELYTLSKTRKKSGFLEFCSKILFAWIYRTWIVRLWLTGLILSFPSFIYLVQNPSLFKLHGLLINKHQTLT